LPLESYNKIHDLIDDMNKALSKIAERNKPWGKGTKVETM